MVVLQNHSLGGAGIYYLINKRVFRFFPSLNYLLVQIPLRQRNGMWSNQLCRDGPPEAHVRLPDARVQLELLQYPHQHDLERVHGVPIPDAISKPTAEW